MVPGVVGNDDPVFVSWYDAREVAIFLSLFVVVCLDDRAHAAELVFELVDAFWGDYAVEAGDFVAYPDEGVVRARRFRRIAPIPSLVGMVGSFVRCVYLRRRVVRATL